MIASKHPAQAKALPRKGASALGSLSVCLSACLSVCVSVPRSICCSVCHSVCHIVTLSVTLCIVQVCLELSPCLPGYLLVCVLPSLPACLLGPMS